MTCESVRALLDPYIDGELSPDESSAVAEHLASCEECAREYVSLLATVHTLREGLVRHHAPDVLRARIRASLREERGARTPVARRDWRFPWRGIAAAVVLMAASSALTLAAVRRQQVAPVVADQVLASHIRSLMPAHLVDVQSSDQHNVKPWFNGRVDFSPAVPPLEDQGFLLKGGRLDYVDGRPVAVVVYTRRQHVINVFSWPAGPGADTRPTTSMQHGYELVHWRADGVEHWVASDLNRAELAQFTVLLRSATPVHQDSLR